MTSRTQTLLVSLPVHLSKGESGDTLTNLSLCVPLNDYLGTPSLPSSLLTSTEGNRDGIGFLFLPAIPRLRNSCRRDEDTTTPRSDTVRVLYLVQNPMDNSPCISVGHGEKSISGGNDKLNLLFKTISVPT